MYVCFGSLSKGEAIKISSLTFSRNVLSSAGSLCARQSCVWIDFVDQFVIVE